MLRFATALQQGKLLSPSMLKSAITPQMDAYGYGFQLEKLGGTPVFGHSGGAPGMSANLMIHPGSGLVMVVLSNQDGRTVINLVQRFKARMPLE